MRNFLFAAMAAVAMLGAGVGGAVGQQSAVRQPSQPYRWMMVKNESDFEAFAIYMKSSGRDCCWSRDLLEDITILAKRKPSGKLSNKDPKHHQPVNFDDGSGACIVDIRISMRPGADIRYQGMEWRFANQNVCSGQRTGKNLDKIMGEIILKGSLPPPKGPKDLKYQLEVENDSLLTAVNIYIIPTDERCCWSYDLLGDETIPKGKSLLVDFNDGSGKCTFDVRITSDREGTDWHLDGVNVCALREDERKITLKSRLVTLKNTSQFDAISVFVIPEGKDCCWSGNLLGEAIIPKGTSLRVNFDDGSGECKFVYRITRSGNGKEWTDKVDVCTATEIILK
jgi:hypothetical protein